MSVIEIENLRVAYSSDETGFTLSLESLQVDAGEELCIMGGSGSGKTTLLHALSGIIRPTSGEICIAGQDLSKMGEAELDGFRAQHIGYVFQTFNLLQPLTALENVAIAASLAGKSQRESRNAAAALLKEMDLESHINRRPSELSVGQSQRVALARALVNTPTLLLADEPTASLDPANAERALASLRAAAQNRGSALVVVTHEPSVQAQFSRVLDLDEVQR